jgi:NTE family protein
MNMIDFFRFRRNPLPIQTDYQRRAVVALGGGGARGLAHLGVMQAIGESGVQTEQIVGVSMGSLVGAMCAVEPNIQRVQATAIELLHSPNFRQKLDKVFGAATPMTEETHEGYFAWYERLKGAFNTRRKIRNLTGPSLMSENVLNDAIDYMLPDIDLADLPIPLSVVAVDLLSGHRIVLERGSLRKAVRASTSIAGFFPPVPWDDMLLCDIGTVDSIPITVAKSYASDLTIAVDVGQEHTAITHCNSAFEVLMRMEDIGERLMRRYVTKEADLVVRPNVGDTSWFDFNHPEKLIAAGREAARKTLSTLPNTSEACHHRNGALN